MKGESEMEMGKPILLEEVGEIDSEEYLVRYGFEDWKGGWKPKPWKEFRDYESALRFYELLDGKGRMARIVRKTKKVRYEIAKQNFDEEEAK